MSVEEYLDLDNSAGNVRYEYIDGVARLMSGGSVGHDRLPAILPIISRNNFLLVRVPHLALMYRCSSDSKAITKSIMSIPMQQSRAMLPIDDETISSYVLLVLWLKCFRHRQNHWIAERNSMRTKHVQRSRKLSW